MSDKEQFTKMLTRAGVIWHESEWNHDLNETRIPETTVIRIGEGDGVMNQGFTNFFTDFEFSADGKLLRVGLWEI